MIKKTSLWEASIWGRSRGSSSAQRSYRIVAKDFAEASAKAVTVADEVLDPGYVIHSVSISDSEVWT